MFRLFGRGSTTNRPEPSNDASNALVTREDGATHAPPTSGRTLLPRPVASMVSMVTQSTSLYVRLCTSLGGFAIDGFRVTTLTGLELSRSVLEGIMIRAGRDVAIQSSGEHGKAEAESILERSVGLVLIYLPDPRG